MKGLVLLVSLLISLSASDAKFDMGREIYTETCVSCHGVDGQAQVEMQFIVRPRSLQASILNEEQTYEIIKKGAHYWGSAADNAIF